MKFRIWIRQSPLKAWTFEAKDPPPPNFTLGYTILTTSHWQHISGHTVSSLGTVTLCYLIYWSRCVLVCTCILVCAVCMYALWAWGICVPVLHFKHFNHPPPHHSAAVCFRGMFFSAGAERHVNIPVASNCQIKLLVSPQQRSEIHVIRASAFVRFFVLLPWSCFTCCVIDTLKTMPYHLLENILCEPGRGGEARAGNDWQRYMCVWT